MINTIKVIDLEVNKEFDLVSINVENGEVVIRGDECGFCRQHISKIKFTNNQTDFVEPLTADNDKAFAEWIGKKHYVVVDLYAEYVREDYPSREVYPNYDSTFIGSRWTTFEEIPQIMADNDNTELGWCLENSYTTDELYDVYLNTK